MSRRILVSIFAILALAAGLLAQDAASTPTPAPLSKAELLARIAQMQAALAALEQQVSALPATPALAAAAILSAPAATTAPVTAAAAPATTQTESASVATTTTKPKKAEPFSFADWSWLNGNSRETTTPLDTSLFTPDIRADVSYIDDFNHPQDDTLVGSTESGRTSEVQMQDLGIGGDFHYDNVRARFMTQFGLDSTMIPENDSSPAHGQWNLANAYRYVSEAYGGYHFDVLHGINVDAGLFMSYIGLFSYYGYDNWAYQPSYVSSNTPWFFNGVRVQIFPAEKLKIEPWFINGWQSYGLVSNRAGLGGQINYRPNGNVNIISNNYGLGHDTLGNDNRTRVHTDNSIEVKYFDQPDNRLDKIAFTLTGDLGCETGGGVSCFGNRPGGPKQSFVGGMAYNRFWFLHDRYGLTFGGGAVNNPGRYLVLMPPINGATAVSGTPYFPESPGEPFKAWDSSVTFDYMPKQYITFRWEFDHRQANVPYFAGPGGVTPPDGNTGAPGSVVAGWTPDLVKFENRIDLALLVKF